MKMIIAVLAVNFLIVAASAQNSQICGQSVTTLFNPQSISQCVVAYNTCEAQELYAAGWMPSANGQCGSDRSSFICGLGGSLMRHPRDASMQVQTLSTCEQAALTEMGWIIVR